MNSTPGDSTPGEETPGKNPGGYTAGECLRAVRENIFTSKYWVGEVLERFKCELVILFGLNTIPVALNIICLGWLSQGPFRTLVYTRHVASEVRSAEGPRVRVGAGAARGRPVDGGD
eukprot:1196183-Prorocentrum_minimum.AAC.6